MPAKRKRADSVLNCMLPKIRLYPADLQRIKQSSAAQRISISEYIRRILSDAIRPPITLQLPDTLSDSTPSEETKKNAGRASEDSQSTAVKRIKKCKAHGLPVHQCSTCNNIGY